MRGHELLRLLAGSAAIYVVMAACGGGGGSGGSTSHDGGATSAGGGGAGDSSGSILDALTDPVPEAAADPNQSGSRLKVNVYVGADGSKLVTGSLHDTQLDVDCGYVLAADGSMRCLPSGAGWSGVFADPACTQPIAAVAKGCSAPAYARIAVPTGTCQTTTGAHVYSIGAPLGSAGAFYLTGQTCSAYSGTPLSTLENDEDLYSVGNEVAASTFVQATVQPE